MAACRGSRPPRPERPHPPPGLRWRSRPTRPSICASSTPSSRSCRPRSPRRSCPGAVVLIGRGDRILYQRAIGSRALVPAVEAMSIDTMFDLASLTKVVATTTSVMMLIERGKLRSERPRGDVHPGLRALRQGRHHDPASADPHVRPPARLDLGEAWTGSDTAIALAVEEVPTTARRPAVRVQRHQLLPARRHRSAGERPDARQVREAGDLRSARHEGHDVSAARERCGPASRRRRAAAVRMALPGSGDADASRRRPRSDGAPHGWRRRSRGSLQHGRGSCDLLPNAARRRRLPRRRACSRRWQSRR